MFLNFLRSKAAFWFLLIHLANTSQTGTAKTETKAVGGDSDAKLDLPVPSLPCRSDVTKSFGLDGIATSIPNDLDMCSGATNSCCSTSDLITISESWNAESGLSSVKSRFQYYQTQYGKVISIIKDVVKIAVPLSTGYKEETNCKQMARVLANFRITQIEAKLLEVQKNMEKFFTEHYRGFYCTLCDATQHVFLDSSTMKATMSQGYCRSLVAHTLPALLYLHLHFPKILKLMVTFVSSCDGTGTFLPAAIDVENLVIDPPSNVMELLTTCKKNINSDEWAASCLGICSKSSIVNLDPFFYPHIDKYSKITTYLSMTMAVLQQASSTMGAEGTGEDATASKKKDDKKDKKKDDKKDDKKDTKAARRMQDKTATTTLPKDTSANTIAAKDATNPTNSTGNSTGNSTNATPAIVEVKAKVTDPAKLYADPRIIESGLNKIINAENFVVSVAEVGLNPWVWGVKSLINKQSVDIAKAKLKIEKMSGATPYSSVLLFGALGYKPDGQPIIPSSTDGANTTSSASPTSAEFTSSPKTSSSRINFFNDTKSPTTLGAVEAAKAKLNLFALKAWMFTSSGGKMGSLPPDDIAKPTLGPDGAVIPANAAAAIGKAGAGASASSKSSQIISTILAILFIHLAF